MRISTFRGVALGAAAAFCATGLAADRAAAELIVLSSQASGYAKGDVLDNEDALTLGEDEALRVMTPSGATREVDGPRDGKVADLEGARDAMTEGFRRVAAYFSGDARDQTKTLATRSADTVFLISGAPFGAEGGSYCYVSSSGVTLERRDSVGETVATVSSGSVRETVSFAEGETSARWPAPVRSGQDYAVALDPGGSATVTLIALRGAAASSERIEATYAEKGCYAQLAAALSAD